MFISVAPGPARAMESLGACPEARSSAFSRRGAERSSTSPRIARDENTAPMKLPSTRKRQATAEPVIRARAR